MSIKLLYGCTVVLVASMACSAQGDVKGASALAGNWHLMGGWGLPLDGLRLTISLEVNGNTVRGGGDLQTFCQIDKSGSGTTFSLAGEVAADGSFVLTDPSFVPGRSTIPKPISIIGTVPEMASHQWSGKFYFPAMGRSKCSAEMSGEFTATPLPALKGLYSGRINLADASTVGATMDVDQGPGVSVHAKLTLSNWSKYPADVPITYESESPSRVNGDELFLYFPVDRGTPITAIGRFTDETELKLQLVLSNLRAGPPGSALDYIGARLGGATLLTRQ